MRARIAVLVVSLVVLLLAAKFTEGQAILKQTNPAANNKVAGPDVPIMLKYKVRLDARLCKLSRLRPDNSTSDLKIAEQQSPDTLNSKATGLQSGAPDGQITRGQIPFTVTGS
jgi:hypothetical protein